MPFKILVVDDEPDVEALLTQRFRRRIRERELAFSFASNGEQALQILHEDEAIDLVLTDINMPVMDGLTLLTRMGGLDSSRMSIIISAYGDMDNIRSAMNLGAFDFITKPINFLDLDATLNKSFNVLLRNKTARQEHEMLVGLQQELNIAREIQQSMIPCIDHGQARARGLSVHGDMVPAREVGGDFFDFFFLDADHVGISIADVSGKGIPAALFMTMSKTLLKATAFSGLSPAKCLDYVNRLLAQDNPMCMFVTVFYAVLNHRTGELCYANGGHNRPIVLRSGADPAFIEPMAGGMVGVDEDALFVEATIRLERGDAIYLYTDGVTEAMNDDPDPEWFGNARLQAALQTAVGCPPEEISQKVKDAVHAFVGGAPQSDDMTMIALRLEGSPTGS